MTEPKTAEPAKEPERLPVGAVIDDRYEVIGYLGLGGMAQVYEARHTDSGFIAAVKVLLDDEEDPALARNYRKRFMREASIAASLMHPNVVQVHDFGFNGPGGQPYIAMERLVGRDLSAELKLNGPLAPARALPLVVDCLTALALGHERGIIHKDLKPANLFLTQVGEDDESLVILDFGVAMHKGIEINRLTEMGTFAGTPQYLAPEYIMDQTVTPALDVYQMGLILAEMLGGQAVLAGNNSYQCIRIHCEGRLPLPDDLMSGPLGFIIRRATALEPSDRYLSAAEFRDALTKVDAEEVARSFTPIVTRAKAADAQLADLPTQVGNVGTLERKNRPDQTAMIRGEQKQTTLPTVVAVTRPESGPTPAAETPVPKKTGNGRQIALVALLIVVVLGAAAVAVWYLDLLP